MKRVIVSGLKVSGKLHLGNYLGTIKQLVDLQNDKSSERFYFIADYHGLTQKYKLQEKLREIYEMAVDAIACGINPSVSIFFIQSHVLEHTNLTWIFNNITSVGRLENMIEYKEKIQEGQSPNAGLLNYPVLMAADILIYKGEFVPVGEDQRQHIELVRDIARAFNRRFGKTFPEPKALYSKTPRIMSLDNPKKKMSKSSPKGCLYLTDPPEIIRRKIQSAVTDSGREIVYQPENRPAIANLLLIYSEITDQTINNIVKNYAGVGYAEFKSDLAEIIIKKLTVFQKRKQELASKPEIIYRLLAEGAEKAQAIASKTLCLAQEKIGLLPFNNSIG